MLRLIGAENVSYTDGKGSFSLIGGKNILIQGSADQLRPPGALKGCHDRLYHMLRWGLDVKAQPQQERPQNKWKFNI